MKLSPQGEAAARLIIDAYARLQAQLAPLDRACDEMIDTMTQFKDSATIPDDELVRRLHVVQTLIAGLPAAVEGLAIVKPSLDVIRRELHAP